ncbi:MAG TPA: hypothetical protein VJL29_00270, partial [Thermoguttaceae bacterium]|nr:hypothetical protein [Thermoguttaceae bacterium]
MHPFTALFVALIFSAASFGLVPPCRAAAGSPADGVEIIPLGGTWDFAYTPEGADTPPDDGRFKTLIPVPGGWDDWIPRDKAHALWPDAKFNPDHAPVRLPLPPKTTKPPDASLPYLLGVGWHRRPIDVPEAWRGRRVVLRVGRTVMEASVWVNGRKVRHHLGHSVPWEVDLSPALEYGKLNELILAVDNRRDDRTGSVIQGYQGRGGGIFGPVSLKVSGPARIADFYVFEQDDRLVWRAELEGKLPQGPELHWAVVDSRDRTILGHGEEPIKKPHLEWTTDAFGIPFWSDDSPRLVEIRLELVDGERRLDSVHRSFGRRRLTCKDAGLRLNGRPVFLRGLCERAYFPETCSPPMDAAWYRRHVRNLKSLGFNWIRAHTWTLTEEYLQAADELGMMVQVEPPRGYQMPEWFDILRACRKHPSVVLYCAGDEETLDESKIEFLRKCADAMRAEVPDALFNPQEAMRGVEYALDGVPRDAISAKPFPHHPRRLAALREFSDVFGQYAWGWLSEDSLRGDPATIDRRLALYKRPCLSHEACAMDGYLDLSLESRYRGTRIGLDLYAQVRAALDKAGLLGRADRYYRCSAAWQRLLRKDVCETARRCGALAGYDLLGANDVHWRFSGCACGIMNEFDEIKHGGTSDNALRYNGPSVLLIDPQRRRNLSADEPFHRDVFVSWFGAEPLPPATTLRWYLLGADGTLYGRGQSRVPRVEPGQIAVQRAGGGR